MLIRKSIAGIVLERNIIGHRFKPNAISFYNYSKSVATEIPVYTEPKINLVGLNPKQIYEVASRIDPKINKFVGNQIYQWIYKKGCLEFDNMANLSLELRKKLGNSCIISYGNVRESQLSVDGTRKLLLEYKSEKKKACNTVDNGNVNDTSEEKHVLGYKENPGDLVETVYIPEVDRGTLCVSSQVGCALNCKFCHTGTQKFMRNLTSSEILGQYMQVAYYMADFDRKENERRKITNLVFMGQGEPLLNYRNLKAAISLLTCKDGIAFPTNKITVSTSGIVPLIEKVATELQVQLAISLHATEDGLRNKLMPINKQYPIKELIKSIRAFCSKSSDKNNRVTFEYVMLDGINDFPGDAVRLSKLIKGIKSHVNLIPFNPWPGTEFKASKKAKINAFYETLSNQDVSCSIRKPRGQDIFAACGQLKSNSLSKQWA
ncbi:hypothetical protein BB559_004869 [Furculomyces boomerangus]|uniref:Radical SAM core domain-containing protein n=1 Tax=Furculomyces boomerangus TaxID=61424 RepID=A0A2T9YC88_9FUNG|nr:hypothetical protein BB559_005613 [Furculomyces boomerangus]PVU89914.1 hypothetical protein BB559_004869 [Furculomyces boomerangus]